MLKINWNLDNSIEDTRKKREEFSKSDVYKKMCEEFHNDIDNELFKHLEIMDLESK